MSKTQNDAATWQRRGIDLLGPSNGLNGGGATELRFGFAVQDSRDMIAQARVIYEGVLAAAQKAAENSPEVRKYHEMIAAAEKIAISVRRRREELLTAEAERDSYITSHSPDEPVSDDLVHMVSRVLAIEGLLHQGEEELAGHQKRLEAYRRSILHLADSAAHTAFVAEQKRLDEAAGAEFDTIAAKVPAGSLDRVGAQIIALAMLRDSKGKESLERLREAVAPEIYVA